MKDNFDLKKFLTENKTIEKSNPFLNESYDEFQRDDEGSKGVTAKDTGEEDAYGAGFEAGEDKDIKLSLRKKIREMVIAELENTSLEEYDSSTQMIPDENEDGTFDMSSVGMKEAKKDEEETPEEDVETEEEVDVDVTDEETTDEEGDEMNVPEMEGDEGEILNHLMKALGMAKSAGDEKLIKQIGNTVTFLTRQYISGE